MKIYYGLTKDETNLKVLKYNLTNNYSYKGVNLSLDGLRSFIKDNNMENIVKYYTILDSDIFKINNDILLDKKYDMIAVQIPFEFEINNIHKL